MQSNVGHPRYVRPFVSSSFLDLKQERDALVNVAFPRLRRYCEARGITWSAVDLRWGIDSEDRVLPVCLDEVARSQPFFIGVLGERYGTTLESIPQHLRLRYPWLERYPHRSITELEIIRGALEECRQPVVPFFYFRDPRPAGEPRGDGAADRHRDRPGTIKLKWLKRRIKRAHAKSLRSGFRSPAELAAWVEEDFIRKIEELYPLSGVPTPRERYALDQRAFALSRTHVHVPIPGVVLELDVHANSGRNALVLVGESGSGKSAALANWAASHADRHPEDLVVTHFVGGADDGGRLDVMVGQLLSALDGHGRTDAETDAETVGRSSDATALVQALNRASRDRRIILVIDGVDQLDDAGGALDLAWLPHGFPENTRIVLSTTPGRSADAARNRKWHVFDMPLLESNQAAEVIRRYLDPHGKKDGFSKSQLIAIIDAPPAANPLFLSTLVDELVPLSSREDVDAVLTDLLQATDVSSLYEKVLARVARDHDADRPGLVRDAFSLIWASRRGLSEAELLDLLGADGQPLPSAYWSALALRADRMFLLRSGLLAFSHAHLRAAVERQFVSTPDEKRRAHLRLAAYFKSRHTDAGADQAHAIEAAGGRLWRKRMLAARLPVDRLTEEYPWQLERAGEWSELVTWLSTVPQALCAFLKVRPDVLHYWAEVEARSPLRAVDLFRPVLDAPEQHRQSIALVSNVLTTLGHTNELQAMAARVVERISDGSDEFAAALFTHVHALIGAADFAAAEAACARAMETFTREGQHEQEAETLRLLSDIALKRGDPERALTLEQQASAILERLGAEEGANRTFRIQAQIHSARGDREAMRECLERAAQVSRDDGDSLGLFASLSELGNLLTAMERAPEAERAYEEAENLLLTLGEPDLLSAFYFNRAAAQQQLIGWHAAKEWYDKCEDYARRIGNATMLALVRLNRASGCSETDHDRALADVEEALTFFRSAGTGAREHLEAALSLKAVIVSAMGRKEEARQCHAESIQVARSLGDGDRLLRCLCNYALLLVLSRDDDQLSAGLELLEDARPLTDKTADAALRTGTIRVARLATDTLGGRMLAADLEGSPAAETFAARLRQWDEAWKLPEAGVHFLTREAVPAVRGGDHQKALTLLEAAATRLVEIGDTKDGHPILRRTLVYLTSCVNPKPGDPRAALAEAELILEPKVRILRALGAKEELIDAYLTTALFITLTFELLPLELGAEARALVKARSDQPLEAAALALDCVQHAIRSVDEAAKLAELYRSRDEMTAGVRAPSARQNQIREAYDLIVYAIARRAARLEQAGAMADACRLLFLRASVARLTQAPALLAATLAELALKLTGVGEAALARDIAAEASALARNIGDSALQQQLAPLVNVDVTSSAAGEGASGEGVERDSPLDEEDRQWVDEVRTLFKDLDARAPGLVQGSSTDDVHAFFAPHMTSDLDVLENAVRMFRATMLMYGVTENFSFGMMYCPRCGDYAAPQGREPGIATVTCGTCKRELQARMIEYSPGVGRAIATLAAEHADVTALVKRASALRHAGDHDQAAALARRAAATFRTRALARAEAGALLEEAAALGDGGHSVAARAAQADAFKILFDLKDVSALTRVILQLGLENLDTRSATAMALFGLLADIVNAHEPEIEATADAVNALYLQALIASRSVNTLHEARKKYDEAFASLTEAASRPGGRKLLSRGFNERFSLFEERLRKDHEGLFELAKNTQTAFDAGQHDAAHLLGAELFKRLAEFGDTRSLLALANRLAVVSFQRKDLPQALEYLRTQVTLADRPGDASTRANALRNQSVLEEALEDNAAQATRGNVEALERVIESAKRDLSAAKVEAEHATAHDSVGAAADAWARAADAAEIIGDTTQLLQARLNCMQGYVSGGRWTAALLAALEAEALTASTAAVAQPLGAQAEALVALGDADTAAMRHARAAPAWQACLKLAGQEPEGLQAYLLQSRDEALQAARRRGDEQAAASEWARAERFYRAASSAAASCLAIDGTGLPVRIIHVATLGGLGVVTLKQGERRREEGLAICRQALQHLDEVDTVDPAGIEQRRELRRELVARVG